LRPQLVGYGIQPLPIASCKNKFSPLTGEGTSNSSSYTNTGSGDNSHFTL